MTAGSGFVPVVAQDNVEGGSVVAALGPGERRPWSIASVARTRRISSARDAMGSWGMDRNVRGFSDACT
jgi:hypothetical protein